MATMILKVHYKRLHKQDGVKLGYSISQLLLITCAEFGGDRPLFRHVMTVSLEGVKIVQNRENADF